MSSTSNVKGRRAQNALWEQHRDAIEDLYINENRTLQDVVRIMATKHNFDRTSSQYEGIFRKWKFRKNFKSKELKSVNYRITKRDAQGKRSDIRLLGIVAKVDKDKIQKRATRHEFQTTLDRFKGPQSPGSPAGITVSTPPAVDGWFLPPVNLPWHGFAQYFKQHVHDTIVPWNISLQNGIISSLSPVFRSDTETIIVSKDNDRGKSRSRAIRALIPMIQDNQPGIDVDCAFGLTRRTDPLEVLKLAVYMLSNNIDAGEISERISELCQIPSNFEFLKRLLEQKDYTILAMAEKLLPFAIDAGDKVLSRLLLETGANPNGKFMDESLLCHCIRGGHTELVYFLLEKGADCATDPASLIESIRKGDIALAKILLHNGANVNHPFRHCLPSAIDTNNIDALRLLLEHNAVFPNLQNWSSSRDSWLVFDREYADFQLVKLLLDYDKPIPGFHIQHEIYHFLEAVVKDGKVELVKQLLELVKPIHDCDVIGQLRGCLPNAVLYGENLEMVKFLISMGAIIDARPRHSFITATALQSASCQGSLDLVNLLLQHGADVNASPSRGLTSFVTKLKFGQVRDMQCTAMQYAVLSGEDTIVSELLVAGASADEECYFNRDFPKSMTALQIAVAIQRIDLVDLLIDHGANVNAPAARTTDGVTALTAALKSSSFQMVQYLLSLGADVNNPGPEHPAASPLAASIEFCSFAMMLDLVQRGADVRDSKALRAAVVREDSTVVRFLLDLNPYPWENVDYGRAALILAIERQNIELVQVLVEAKVELNGMLVEDTGHQTSFKKHYTDYNAICAATWTMDPRIFQILLDGGADVNEARYQFRNIYGFRGNGSHSTIALINTEHENVLEVAKLLLRYGAKLNDYGHFEAETTKFTILQRAAKQGKFDLIQCLLEAEADINSPPSKNRGRTALQVAAENNNIKMVELLIAHSANVNAAASVKYGATPLQFAASNGNFEIVHLLLDAGAYIDAPRGEREGRTALEGAAEHGRLDMVKFLLECGAQVDGTYHEQYFSAVKLAREEGHMVLAKMLEEYRRDKYPDLEWKLPRTYCDCGEVILWGDEICGFCLENYPLEDYTESEEDSEPEENAKWRGDKEMEDDFGSRNDSRSDIDLGADGTAPQISTMEMDGATGVHEASRLDEDPEDLMHYDHSHLPVELPPAMFSHDEFSIGGSWYE